MEKKSNKKEQPPIDLAAELLTHLVKYDGLGFDLAKKKSEAIIENISGYYRNRRLIPSEKERFDYLQEVQKSIQNLVII